MPGCHHVLDVLCNAVVIIWRILAWTKRRLEKKTCGFLRARSATDGLVVQSQSDGRVGPECVATAWQQR